MTLKEGGVMAFYDWNAFPLLPYAKIYDANGLEITDVMDCDTETGELCRIIRDKIDPNTGLPDEIVEKRAAPLLVVFDKEPYDSSRI